MKGLLRSPTSKWIGGILGAILIGGIGSGFWQYVLSPLTFKCRDTLLTLATLGITKFKDSTYQEIALGFHEETSVALYSLIDGMIAGVLTIVAIELMLRARRLREDHKELLLKVSNLKEGHIPQKKTLDDLAKDTAHTRDINRIIKVSYAIVVGTVGMFIFSVVSSAQTNYINNAITRYHLLETLAAPTVSDAEIKNFRFRFARIQNKADYDSVMTDLEAHLSRSGVKLKPFSSW